MRNWAVQDAKARFSALSGMYLLDTNVISELRRARYWTCKQRAYSLSPSLRINPEFPACCILECRFFTQDGSASASIGRAYA